MSHFDNTYSKNVPQEYKNIDSESSFIGGKFSFRDDSEDSSIYFQTKKRKASQLPMDSRHITSFHSILGCSIETVAFNQYLNELSKHPQLIDSNMLLLLSGYLAKANYRNFTQFIVDICPFIDEFSIIILIEMINVDEAYKRYLRENSNFITIFNTAIEQRKRGLLQLFLEIKPFPEIDLTEKCFELMTEVIETPTEQGFSFTKMFVEKLFTSNNNYLSLINDYIIMLLKVFVNSEELLAGSVQALIGISNSEYRQYLVGVLKYFKIDKPLSLDQQYFLLYLQDGKEHEEYQFENIVYHIDISYILSKIQQMYQRSSSNNQTVIVHPRNNLPLNISSLIDLLTEVIKEINTTPKESLKIIQVILSNILYQTKPLTPDFLHLERKIEILFQIIPILCKIKSDEFEILYLAKEVLYYDLIVLYNIASIFPCIDINSCLFLFDHYQLLQDNFITHNLMYLCFCAFNYYRPQFTDESLTILLENTLELYFENDEYQIDCVIDKTILHDYIPLTMHTFPESYVNNQTRYTTPLMMCIEHCFISYNINTYFLYILKENQILYDDVIQEGKVKKKDLIEYVRKHNPLLSLEIILSFLDCSSVIIKRLITKKDKLQYCGLVNNALQLINKIFELISLKFTDNKQFFKQIDKLKERLITICEENEIIKQYIQSNYFKLSIKADPIKINIEERMRDELENALEQRNVEYEY